MFDEKTVPEGVKVEVELSRSIYEALKLIGTVSRVSVEELLKWAARGEAEAFVNGPVDAFTEHFMVPLVENVEALLEAE